MNPENHLAGLGAACQKRLRCALPTRLLACAAEALRAPVAAAMLCLLGGMGVATAEEKKELIEIPLIKKHKAEKAAAAEAAAAPAEPATSETVKQLRQALTAIGTPVKPGAQTSTESSRAGSAGARTSAAKPHGAAGAGAADSQASRNYIRARALALARGEALPQEAGHGSGKHGGEAHWAYEGEYGPQAWGKLKPEYKLCAAGKRQSPIAIRDDFTLQGPAEPIQFKYQPSTGSVVNNGHTIQVDLEGDNTITVRSSTYKLLQFHFHTPSEEMVNNRRYAMVAHLVHRNEAGQLAVVAVLLEPGERNGLIDKVWTYMPLDTNDRVRLPEGFLNMNELLPEDQRYYQFMGSLTTPPCSEGVLWMVIKQPVRISPEQFKLFSQLFPLNARPVQPVNGRPVREAR